MGKTVLITGCSSGFGRALCNEFKDLGYYVIATARNVMRLSDVKADLKIEIDKLKDMMDVNVFGTIRMMQAVLTVMRKHGGGRIQKQ